MYNGATLAINTSALVFCDNPRGALRVVPPERVYLTTDCGMKPLSRIVARMKLRALAEGARIVRNELGHG